MVLDAVWDQRSTTNGRRVVEIQFGGIVELIGLNITGGFTYAVQNARLLNPLRHFLPLDVCCLVCARSPMIIQWAACIF